jgi:hypothetical protein
VSWSYDQALSTARDRVRFLIGDTDSAEPQFQDEELDYLLTDAVSETAAAVTAVQGLIAKYSRRVDRQVGSLKISSSKMVENYTALLKTLTTSAAAGRGYPTAGGVYQSEKDAAAANDTLVQPSIRRGIHDF